MQLQLPGKYHTRHPPSASLPLCVLADFSLSNHGGPADASRPTITDMPPLRYCDAGTIPALVASGLLDPSPFSVLLIVSMI